MRGDDCCDQTRNSQNCCREARFGTGTQILLKHQNIDPESIHASRMVEINKWRERGVVERWSRQAAMAAGGQMFNARWVDEQRKEKSRYVVKDFANTRDPTMCLQQPVIQQWEEWKNSRR